MKPRTKFSEALLVCRMTHGLSQKNFSKLVNASSVSICHWETGKRSPSVKQIAKLAEILKLTPLELLYLIEEDEEPIRA
jgi:transcriptional regulator with XRE-family HTH domain